MLPKPPPVRLAQITDLPEVEAIVHAAYTPWIAIIGQKPGPLLDNYAAAIKAGQVHITTGGLVVLIDAADHMLLENVAVHPDHRGNGLGRHLIRFAEDTARHRGHQTIRLYAHIKMTRNIALYQQLGYTISHQAEERGLTRIYMQKPL